jgi:chromosome segregation ATPase
MSNDYLSIRDRILALVPTERHPFAEFELRMLTTTLESDNLRYIHQHWRPIADERDQLREQLAASSAEPVENRRGLRGKAEALQTQYDELLKKHMDLQDSFATLQAAHAALQKDCDELLADKLPSRRTT